MPFCSTPDPEPSEDVDRHDDETCDRIAPYELARAVHRAVEVRLLLELAAPSARLLIVDHAMIQIGVDRHLLSRHRIECEASRHLRDASGTLRDHDEVDDEEDQEDDEADEVVATDGKRAEGFDQMARGAPAFISLEQDQAGARDVQTQTEQCHDQQQRGKYREIEWPLGIDRYQQDQQGNRERDREQNIQESRGDRQREHRENPEERRREESLGVDPLHGETPQPAARRRSSR
ncbi:MAG: hypothetical protein M5U32_03030 [Myxococcota bacterium]|nr:hypothetical protein [Myxococcota bacterium]